MKRWERLAISNVSCEKDFSKWCDCATDYFIDNSYKFWIDNDPVYSPKTDQRFDLSFSLIYLFTPLFLNHCEVPHPFGSVQEYLYACSKLSVRYMVGKWREGYKLCGEGPSTTAENRSKIKWLHEYQYGLLSSLLLNAENELCILADWPGLDILMKTDRYSESDCLFYFLLAQYIKHGNFDEYKTESAKISKGSRRRPKYLVGLLDSIHDEKAFTKNIEKYINFYIKNESDNRNANHRFYVSQDASILWNLALREGMKLATLPTEIMDRIFTPQSIGLEL